MLAVRKHSLRGNQKGFLGPIGDDLPSLIPLTVALLVFFGAFGFAFTSFEEKKLAFDQRLLVLSIARTLKGDSLLDQYQKWENACQSIEVARYKFRAVVFKISTAENATFYNYEFFSDWQKDDTTDSKHAKPYTWTSDKRIFIMKDSSGNEHRLVCDNLGSSTNPHDDLEKIFSSRALAQKSLRVNFPLTVFEKKAVNGEEINAFRPAILSVMVWKS